MTAERIHIPERIHRHPAVWWSRVKNQWPVVIWLAAIGAGLFFYNHGGQFGGMSGVVEAVREEIAPLENARLKTIEVTMGQRVKKGDVLATLDMTMLETQVALDKLQLEIAVSRAETDLRDMRIRQAESAGELEVLNTEVARLDELLARRLIDAETVSRLRARQQALARSAEFYPDTIRKIEDELGRLREWQARVNAQFNKETGDLGLEAAGEETRKGDISVLRALSDGTVSEIYYHPGSVVPAGLPILSVVKEGPQQVIGFLSEINARSVSVGMTAYLKSLSGEGVVVRARVIALLPDIATLPNRVSPFPEQTYRGRRVILQPVEPSHFLPGESVAIELKRPWLARWLASRGNTADGGL